MFADLLGPLLHRLTGCLYSDIRNSLEFCHDPGVKLGHGSPIYEDYMRHFTAVLLATLAAPPLATASELECLVIRTHIEKMQDASFAAIYSTEAGAQDVKDAVNKILIDPRMPADLADEGRKHIFGDAFDRWETTYKEARYSAQYPEDPAFEALMREKCGRNWR
ncbi:hypothetical protein PDE01_48630 [Paracoccus denitrificans]|nr:hypothetical protein PDE01_48630 [Paracoccus denitrificans]